MKRYPPISPVRWIVAAFLGAGVVAFAASHGFGRESPVQGPGLDRSARMMSGTVAPLPVPAPAELRRTAGPDAAVLSHAVLTPAMLQQARLQPMLQAPLAPPPAAAGGSARREPSRFVYMAADRRLSDVLRDFAASQAMPAVLADGIEGIVTGNFDTTAREFLQAISQAYGILWYHDGAAYYFYPARAIQSRMFRLKGYSREELTSLLASFRLGDARYPIRYNAAQQTLMVYGPPRHVELVASAVEALDLGAAEGNESSVKVFRLRYATAGDRTMGDARVPGVVTTLRGLYARNPAAEDGAASLPPTLVNKVQALQPTGDARKAMQTIMAPGPNAGAAAGTGPAVEKPEGGEAFRGLRSPVNFEDDRPSFEADEGSNSVVVQGRAHRMREYETLIRRLDQKPVLLELEATIIDITSDSVRLLGIDWAAQGGRAAVSVVQPPLSAAQTAAGALVDAASFSMSTVVSGAGRALLARVNALQGEGKARIQSKPSILGVANRPAVMKEKRIATVRVAGNLEANLFQVEAGTLLQVTPQVTLGPDGVPQIKLSLYIEDGNFESSVVDQVPVVKKTEIRTEAHVKEGESLLIGGLVIDGDVRLESSVPGLGRIPLIGALFRSNSNRATRFERLFMITPRLVGDGVADDRTGEAQVGAATAPATPAAPSAPSAVVTASREARMDALIDSLRQR